MSVFHLSRRNIDDEFGELVGNAGRLQWPVTGRTSLGLRVSDFQAA
jgi:hypothetical protein